MYRHVWWFTRITFKAAQELAEHCELDDDELDADFFNHRDDQHAATRDVVHQAELSYRLR